MRWGGKEGPSLPSSEGEGPFPPSYRRVNLAGKAFDLSTKIDYSSPWKESDLGRRCAFPGRKSPYPWHEGWGVSRSHPR